MNRSGLRVALTVFIASGAVCLSACSLPRRVEPPALERPAPLGSLQLPAGTWPTSDWWTVYGDPQLDRLIRLALREAADLQLASARVQSAESAMRLTAAQAGLSVNGSAQWSRRRMSDNGILPTEFLGIEWYSQADIGVQLRYQLDWWGKRRAAVEAAAGELRAAAAQADAATLAIQHAVADTYFAWLGDQARLAVARDALAAQERLADIARLRVRRGVDLPDQAQAALAQLAAAREQRAALEGAARVRLAGLAALVGVSMDRLPRLVPRPLPAVAQGLPADASLDLVARRPDITASRWLVQAALRRTDVARAEFLPDLSLAALAGLSSIDMDRLFEGSSRVFELTPAVHLPIFNSGLLKANYGASRAQLDAAIASYRSTVLAAVREVSSQALLAQMLAERRREQGEQLDAVRQLSASAASRLRQGVSDARELLQAQLRLFSQRDSALQVDAQALATDLALVRALGGGYRDPSDAQTAKASTSSSHLSSAVRPDER
ncbi:MAG: efflux transporter outer membrane subunit [Pseudomonadota bacterium]